MKKSLLILLSFIAITANAEDTNKVITVNCKGTLEKITAYGKVELKGNHKLTLEIQKESDDDQLTINRNGQIKFPEGYEVVYNINVHLGKGRLFGSRIDTVSEIRARLQRHTGGNGKIVLGASRLAIKQKPEKKKSNISINIVNVRALDDLVNSTKLTDIENDPILLKNNYKEAVYSGMLDEGVIKSAQIECSTL